MTTLILWVILAFSVGGEEFGAMYSTKQECLEVYKALVANPRTAILSECVPVKLTVPSKLN